MLDVIIFIASVGPNVSKRNIIDTIHSYTKNIGDYNFKFYIVVSNPEIEQFVKDLFENEKLSHVIKKGSLLDVVQTKGPWGVDYNEFRERHQDSTKYILVSHDDVVMRTPNFLEKTFEEISGKEDEVGWIVYTNDHYYNLPSGPMPNTTKIGFHTDIDKYPFVWECHNFEPGQQLTEDNKHLMDFPERAVKCHAAMFIPSLISARAMKTIGPCAVFGPYTLLLDEDFSLEALKNNLFNVWIPSIIVTHPNPAAPRRVDGLRGEEEAHQRFYEKWGFYAHRDYLIPEKRTQILEKYKHTNIPWSANRKSYEWDYLK